MTLIYFVIFFKCLEKIPVSVEIPHRKAWHYFVEVTYAEAAGHS